jgi:hypothetical protein
MYFILHPYFIQNKYVPHTNNLPPPPEDEQRPPLGGSAPHSLGTSAIGTSSSCMLSCEIASCFRTQHAHTLKSRLLVDDHMHSRDGQTNFLHHCLNFHMPVSQNTLLHVHEVLIFIFLIDSLPFLGSSLMFTYPFLNSLRQRQNCFFNITFSPQTETSWEFCLL